MTLAIYPDATVLPGLGFNVGWSPTFYNMKTDTTTTGADIDLGLAQYPLHDFELTYEFLRDFPMFNRASLEFRTLMGFHLQIGGTLGRFLFRNVDDCWVNEQLIGTGDGTTTTFTLVRTFGANGYSGTEPVGQVDTTFPFKVYLNNSSVALPSSLYTLSTANPVANTITFATAPLAGYTIRVDMHYFYYCKLATNVVKFEKFMNRLWLLQKVDLHSCRQGA